MMVSDIKLSKQDKILLLEIARQGYITEEQARQIKRIFSMSEISIRYVSTAAEIKELERLDELRKKYHIEGDTSVSWDNDKFIQEVNKEIADLRDELKQDER